MRLYLIDKNNITDKKQSDHQKNFQTKMYVNENKIL